MTKRNMVLDKTLTFATQIFLLCRTIQMQHKEYDMTRQLSRCSSSIGANICEAQFAASKADFIAKMKIAEKEANETSYWLKLLHNVGYINDSVFYGLYDSNSQIKHLLSTIINKSKLNMAR